MTLALPVGAGFPERVVGPLGPEAVGRYAAVSGDHNPIHRDAEAARAIGLAGPVVHGMLVMGLVETAVEAWLPEARCTKLTTRFAAPLPVGASVRLAARLVKAEGMGADWRGVLRVFVREEAGQVVAIAEAALAG